MRPEGGGVLEAGARREAEVGFQTTSGRGSANPHFNNKGAGALAVLLNPQASLCIVTGANQPHIFEPSVSPTSHVSGRTELGVTVGIVTGASSELPSVLPETCEVGLAARPHVPLQAPPSKSPRNPAFRSHRSQTSSRPRWLRLGRGRHRPVLFGHAIRAGAEVARVVQVLVL